MLGLLILKVPRKTLDGFFDRVLAYLSKLIK